MIFYDTLTSQFGAKLLTRQARTIDSQSFDPVGKRMNLNGKGQRSTDENMTKGVKKKISRRFPRLPRALPHRLGCRQLAQNPHYAY